MRFKHSFKILIARFSLVWNILFYYFLITVIIASVGAAILIPLIDTFKSMGLAQDFNEILVSLFQNESPKALSTKFMDLYFRIINEFLVVPKVGWSLRIFLLGIIGILARLLYGFGEMAVLSVLEGHMSANARYSFAGAYLSNLWKSIKYQISKMLLTLPYDTFMVFVLYLMTFLFRISALRLFLPLLIMIIFIVLVSFRLTALSHWGASIAVDNKGVFKGFKHGLKLVFRRKNFLQVFSAFVVVVILAIAINIFVTFFTLGAGLLLTVPFTILWCNSLSMTSYYVAMGRRYYIDSDTIVTSPTVKDE